MDRAGTEVRVEAQHLAQGHVDAAEARSDRRGDGALEGDLVAPDGLEHVVRERRPVLGHDAFAGVLDLPLERDARGVQDTAGGIGELGADTVPGDERDSVRHGSHSTHADRLGMGGTAPLARMPDGGPAGAIRPYRLPVGAAHKGLVHARHRGNGPCSGCAHRWGSCSPPRWLPHAEAARRRQRPRRAEEEGARPRRTRPPRTHPQLATDGSGSTAGGEIDLGGAVSALGDLDNYAFRMEMKSSGSSEFIAGPQERIPRDGGQP